MSEQILLVCTVGGTAEPLVASLKHWRPARVLFIGSPESASGVDEAIVPAAQSEGVVLDPGRYDVVMLSDGQNLAGCLGTIRGLNNQVEDWLQRGDDFRVVVDFTGGTKCMTAALALHAHRWPCQFSYVGGSERDKGGVGVVVSGTEKMLHNKNPWDAMGYQAVDDFVVLFDQGAYGPAVEHAQAAMSRIADPASKRELGTLKTLAEGYAAWDRFDHKRAANLLGNISKNANDLKAMFPAQTVSRLQQQIPKHVEHLSNLVDRDTGSQELITDLLANADRRAKENRFDDAVARLYRATEALAQVRLRACHGIADTASVPLSAIPEALQEQWSAKAENRILRLGLRDAYQLLAELGDDVGKRFQELKWHEREHSPLAARNQSVLAHGFVPVAEKVFKSLWRGCLTLTDIEESNLPVFPRLG